MATDPAHIPSEIKQHDEQTLSIRWSDQVLSLINVRALRLACGCAHCIDEWTGQPLLDASEIPEDVAPRGIQPVGRYAIQIDWSDGHDTGIYPFSRLRGLADQGVLTGIPTEGANGAKPLP